MQAFTDFNMQIMDVSNDTVSHLITETSILCERNYRYHVVELYRAIYPALKYQDTDILHEAINVTKTVFNGCINANLNIVERTYRRSMAQINAKLSVYNKLASKAKIIPNKMEKTYDVKIPQYTYIYGIPDITVLHTVMSDIRDDRNIFLSHDMSKINKLRGNITSYIENITRDILKVNKCPDKPTKYFYESLRNDGKYIATTIDRDFIMYRCNLSSHFNNQIKDVTKTMGEYKALMNRYNAVVMSYCVNMNAMDAIDTAISSYTDSDASFFAYEMTKLTKIMDTVTPLIMCKIEAINDELSFNIDILSQYIECYTGSINHITIREDY